MVLSTIMENAKKYDSDAEIKGVLIVEMVKGGKEMIIGSKLEPGIWSCSYAWYGRNLCGNFERCNISDLHL